MARAHERTAVLVIRVWLEDEDQPSRLRARITSTRDVMAAWETETAGVASEKEIVNAVRIWLRTFVAAR